VEQSDSCGFQKSDSRNAKTEAPVIPVPLLILIDKR
jgi:hypothetical protein